MAELFPKVLKNFDLYIDGDSIGRSVESVKLPSTTMKYETLETGVFSRPVDIPVGFENSMELKIATKGINFDLLVPQGCGLSSTTLQFKGFIEDPGTCDKVSFTANFTGRFGTESDPLKKGEAMGGTVTFKAVTAEYIVNGTSIYEERVLENVLIVNGKDLKAEENAALGRM